MLHDAPLISTIVAGFTLALVFGMIANRLRVSPLIGYLLAGIAMGPHTPGFVGNQALASELAEIGVILLMFGVGLHFTVRELYSVRVIAVPGALAQIVVATLLGGTLALHLGWGMQGALVFGLALSVASTVVLLRSLQEYHLLSTPQGKIAVGWLVVEDLVMVLALVLLPAVAPIFSTTQSLSFVEIAGPLLVTIAKAAAFVAVMLLIGRKVIPALLHYAAHTGSRELFRLAVLTTSLGVAVGAAALFGVSLALGAFFAGMVLAESEFSQRAAEETLPLRDAFAVLFFVSVGMLFDPLVIVRDFWALLATVAIIVVGKSVAAYGIVRLFGHPDATAMTISASLAQIGEFSFILANLGYGLGMLPVEGRDLILGGSLISILLSPLFFAATVRFIARPSVARIGSAATPPQLKPDARRSLRLERVVLIGHGRVGSAVSAELRAAGCHLTVIEENSDIVSSLAEAKDLLVVEGNGTEPSALLLAKVDSAELLVVTVPDAFQSGLITERARALNSKLKVICRAHSDNDVAHLEYYGADAVIMGERELAAAMIRWIRAGF
jgi:CPA2 family monovalent cation:H+ antiporter-2